MSWSAGAQDFLNLKTLHTWLEVGETGNVPSWDVVSQTAANNQCRQRFTVATLWKITLKSFNKNQMLCHLYWPMMWLKISLTSRPVDIGLFGVIGSLAKIVQEWNTQQNNPLTSKYLGKFLSKEDRHWKLEIGANYLEGTVWMSICCTPMPTMTESIKMIPVWMRNLIGLVSWIDGIGLWKYILFNREAVLDHVTLTTFP